MKKNNVQKHSGYFKELEHTADLALEVGGPTLETVFTQAANGLLYLMLGNNRITPTESRLWNFKAPSSEDLLVDWLSEIVYQINHRRTIVVDIGYLHIKQTGVHIFLNVEAAFGAIPESVLEEMPEIKAVTYHQMDIKQTEKGLTTRIIFDI